MEIITPWIVAKKWCVPHVPSDHGWCDTIPTYENLRILH